MLTSDEITPATAHEITNMLGIVNSELMSFYHNITSPKAAKGLFPKILVNDVRKIPIRLSDESSTRKLADCVKSMLSNPKTTLDKEIDNMVYKIYKITEEEKKYIERWFEAKQK